MDNKTKQLELLIVYRNVDKKGNKIALIDGVQSIAYMDSKIPPQSDDFKAMGDEHSQPFGTKRHKKSVLKKFI